METKSNKRKWIKIILILGVVFVFFLVKYKKDKSETILTYNNEQFFPYQDTYNEVLSFESETFNVYYNHKENGDYLECGTFQYYYTVYEYYDEEDDFYYLFLGSWVYISPVNSSSNYYSVNKNMYQSFSISSNEDVGFECGALHGPSSVDNPYDLSICEHSRSDLFSCDIDFANYKKHANIKYIDSSEKCNEDTKIYSYSIFFIEDFSQYDSPTFTFDYLSEASFYVNGPLLENYNVETDDDLNNISTTKEFSYAYGV